LLEALPQKDRPLWATGFYSGLRPGELQALRVSDVNIEEREIRVERTWDRVEGPVAPKTPKSRRTVAMLADLRPYLVQHLLASGRRGDDLVFGRTATIPFLPHAVRERAYRAWDAAGLERFTLHETRHTLASILFDADVNVRAISDEVGHSKTSITMDVYAHLYKGSRDELRRKADEYLRRQAEGQMVGK